MSKVFVNNDWIRWMYIAKIVKFAYRASYHDPIQIITYFFVGGVIFKCNHRLVTRMDIQEFQIKVYPLKNKLFRFAKRLLDRTEEAEDAVQEVFIKLWNRRDKLDEYRSVEALAMITIKNFCLDKIKARRYTVENMENHRQFLENIPDEPKTDHSDLIRSIHQAIRLLPEQQQIIVHLRDIEGYEFEKIAEIVEMNENAIRVALSRARKRIRELLTNTKIYEYQRN
jgi:RNA polymerase sigma factor (sigma-70 family)